MFEQADALARETKGLFAVLNGRIEREINELDPMADNLS